MFFVLLLALASAADFKSWAAKHNKHYTAAEALRRRTVFSFNARFAANFNKLGKFKLSVDGPYAAMTNAEYRETLKALPRKANRAEVVVLPELKRATDFDLRDQNLVPPVRDQASCGSCYTFGSLASVEGRLLKEQPGKYTYKTLDLSEQQLVDCSKSYGNQGCNGGLGTNVYDYIKAHGVALEKDFPYTATEGTCTYTAAKKAATIKNYVSVTSKSVSQMKTALQGGIVDTSIDASSIKFQLYSSGAYTDSSCGTGLLKLNHEVSAIGHKTIDGVDTLIVRNSWGESWGEGGYIYMAFDGNTCGILTDPYYPTGVAYA